MESLKSRAAVVMGSDSDFPTVKVCINMLKDFGVEVDVSVISAHRTPDKAAGMREMRNNGLM